MLLNRKWIASVVEDMTKSPGLMWLAGLVALMMGVVIVNLNNYWTSGLPLFVTILGWLTLIKGAVILLFPKITISYYNKLSVDKMFAWGGVVVCVIGILLLSM